MPAKRTLRFKTIRSTSAADPYGPPVLHRPYFDVQQAPPDVRRMIANEVQHDQRQRQQYRDGIARWQLLYGPDEPVMTFQEWLEHRRSARRR